MHSVAEAATEEEVVVGPMVAAEGEEASTAAGVMEAGDTAGAAGTHITAAEAMEAADTAGVVAATRMAAAVMRMGVAATPMAGVDMEVTAGVAMRIEAADLPEGMAVDTAALRRLETPVAAQARGWDSISRPTRTATGTRLGMPAATEGATQGLARILREQRRCATREAQASRLLGAARWVRRRAEIGRGTVLPLTKDAAGCAAARGRPRSRASALDVPAVWRLVAP